MSQPYIMYFGELNELHHIIFMKGLIMIHNDHISWTFLVYSYCKRLNNHTGNWYEHDETGVRHVQNWPNIRIGIWLGLWNKVYGRPATLFQPSWKVWYRRFNKWLNKNIFFLCWLLFSLYQHHYNRKTFRNILHWLNEVLLRNLLWNWKLHICSPKELVQLEKQHNVG